MIFTLYSFSSLLAWMTALSCGLLVYFNNRNNPINITYFWLSLTITIWVSGCFMESTFTDPKIIFLVDLFLYTGAAFAPTAFLHSILEIIYKAREKRIALIACYSTSVFFLVVNFFYRDLYIVDVNHRLTFRFIADPGILWYVFVLFFIIASTYGLVELYKTWYLSKGVNRRKFAYLSVSYTTVIIAASFYLLLVFKIETPPIDNYLVIAYSLLMTYSITKAQLMDISLIVSRGVAYAITSIIYIFGYIFIIKTYRQYISNSIDSFFVLLTVIYGALIGYSFERLRLLIQTTSDKLFLKGKYDFRDALTYISEKLASVVSLDDLFKTMELFRLEKIEASMLKIYIVNSNSDLNESKGAMILPKDHFVLEFSRKSKSLLFVSEFNKGQKEELKKDKIEIVVPCFINHELIAILFVGNKLSEDQYTDEELDVFKILAPQIATVIERTRPYEAIKGDLVVEQEKVKFAAKAMEENSRLVRLGTLAAGVAHEIRNPMAILKLRAERGSLKLEDKEFIKETNAMMIKYIDRVLGIVSKMLKFAKDDGSILKQVDVKDVIEDTLDFLAGKMKEKAISLEKEFEGIALIDGNHDSLSEAFLNIILNSIDAMKGQGKISVKVKAATMFDEKGKEKKAVLVEISDSGEGIPQDKIDQIFNPFFTTKHTGTGLGLSITHKILAQEHGGQVDVKSEVGKGTTFTIYFPASMITR